jgi:hypothetical protein
MIKVAADRKDRIDADSSLVQASCNATEVAALQMVASSCTRAVEIDGTPYPYGTHKQCVPCPTESRPNSDGTACETLGPTGVAQTCTPQVAWTCASQDEDQEVGEEDEQDQEAEEGDDLEEGEAQEEAAIKRNPAFKSGAKEADDAMSDDDFDEDSAKKGKKKHPVDFSNSFEWNRFSFSFDMIKVAADREGSIDGDSSLVQASCDATEVAALQMVASSCPRKLEIDGTPYPYGTHKQCVPCPTGSRLNSDGTACVNPGPDSPVCTPKVAWTCTSTER